MNAISVISEPVYIDVDGNEKFNKMDYDEVSFKEIYLKINDETIQTFNDIEAGEFYREYIKLVSKKDFHTCNIFIKRTRETLNINELVKKYVKDARSNVSFTQNTENETVVLDNKEHLITNNIEVVANSRIVNNVEYRKINKKQEGIKYIKPKLRDKNRHLLYLMHKAKIKTNMQLCLECNISPTEMSKFIYLQDGVVFDKHGRYTKMANRIASYFDVFEEKLFPPELYGYSFFKTVQGNINALPDIQREQNNSFKNIELHIMLNEAMAVLSSRQKFILEDIFYYNLTYNEIGIKLNLTGARINQIKEKALIKLRHPEIIKKLRGYWL